MSSHLKFFFKTAAGERIETTIAPPEDTRSAIVGTLVQDAAPVANALVLLFDAEEHLVLDQTFTDEDGVFFFGPLLAEKLYYIDVYRSGCRVRTLEVRI